MHSLLEAQKNPETHKNIVVRVCALPSIAVMSVWQGVGYQMIIFLGGLQNINPALYEAAEMDHASGWQKFKDITLPELKPLCVFVFITVTIGAFRMLVQR